MKKTKMSMTEWEAEDRAWAASVQIEHLLQGLDGDEYQEDLERSEYFAIQCLNLLSDKFAISAPAEAFLDNE
ncbi:MAG TPA: hypothetical protein VFN23_02025 [Ktedonobacteraceae bacterium]|nr:hypothetical protein [Ktedonobacteraceae bacterium]